MPRHILLTLLTVFTTVALQSAASAEAPKPNVVLFLVDDMGWIDAGVYGSQYYETPEVDRLAKRGMLFTDAYSAHPLCSPTRASILTGKYPARLGITTAAGHLPPQPKDAPRYPDRAPPNRQVITPESLRYLDPEEYTLAEALRDAGYRTGHFGKWHLGLKPEHWPERQGFDVAWHGKPDAGPRSYFSPYRFEAGTVTDGPEGEYIVDRQTDEAIRFIKENRDRPFFVNLWQYGVHGPWQAKEEYIRRYAERKDPRGRQHNPVMAAMLKSVDESLGRIVATLDELGLAERTILIFASDNGGNVHSNTEQDRRRANIRPGHPRWESLRTYREHAGYAPPTNNHPLRDGKGRLYEGGIRVPMIVVWPGVVPSASRSEEPVSTIDYYPTVLDLAGVPRRDGVVFDGVSLAPVLRDPQAKLEREALFNFFPHGGPGRPPGVTVRQGDWKLIRWFETSQRYPSVHELYNLGEDIGETNNLAAEHPERVERMDALIDRFLEETKALVPKPNPDYRAEAAAGRDDPLLGWVARFSRAKVEGDALRIEGEGRSPFLAITRLRASGPVELRLRLRSGPGGSGSVRWRTGDQDSFPQDGQTASFSVAAGPWQDVRVPLSVEGELAHLRLHLPAHEQAVEVDRIELWSAAEPPRRIRRWDFGADD
jgi:arylsulfatase A-like enzyme